MADFDRNHALSFLTAVFAGRPGLVQVCATGKWTGRFFRTDQLDQAADYARSLDGLRAAGIYFRATTVAAEPATGARGGADDTLATPCMWGDVDFGTEGHKGEALPPTAEDAMTVIRETGIGEPTILIHSGGGLYPIWMLDREVTKEDAARLAEWTQEALLVASQRHGWAYGTGVKDLARVLRLPGSANRKTANVRPCRVIGGTGLPISPDAIPEPAVKATTAPVVGGAHPLPPRRDPGGLDPNRRRGPLDVLAELTSWVDILEPAGWTFVASESGGSERWLRPGDATSEYSARCFEHNMVCHSESAGLPSGAGQRLTKGRVYAWLWHGGDLSEATRALLDGDNRCRLPDHVLDAIRATTANPIRVRYLTPSPQQFMAGEQPTEPVTEVEGITDEDIDAFLNTFTAYRDPYRLARREGWMKADSPRRLGHHAVQLCADAIAGHYPADRAARALIDGYRHHGITDPAPVQHTLKLALGAILSTKASA